MLNILELISNQSKLSIGESSLRLMTFFCCPVFYFLIMYGTVDFYIIVTAKKSLHWPNIFAIKSNEPILEFMSFIADKI